MIYVSCSNNPFRLYEENDLFKIIAYLGIRRQDNVLFSDIRKTIVPSSLEWVFVGCDVNKDIEIEGIA
jgi:hypothetical protein